MAAAKGEYPVLEGGGRSLLAAGAQILEFPPRLDVSSPSSLSENSPPKQMKMCEN